MGIDVEKDVVEIEKEWKELKSKAFWVLLGFSGSILAIGIWVGTVQSDMRTLQKDLVESTEHHERYEVRLNALEINNAGVLARLASIDLALQEIKVAIKNIK